MNLFANLQVALYNVQLLSMDINLHNSHETELALLFEQIIGIFFLLASFFIFIHCIVIYKICKH